MESMEIDDGIPKPSKFSAAWNAIGWYIRSFRNDIDNKLNQSTFGRLFRLRGCGHPKEIERANFTTEVSAGLTTFATMAYIIAVNADILQATGGTCVCINPQGTGRVCDNEAEYVQCQSELKRDLVTATAAISGLATISFGLFTNLPVALAPGMGLNAYFTYQVVGYRGGGPVPYDMALTAVFVEGFIFVFLALTGLRQWLVKAIPNTLKVAGGVGIGLFLTLIGMSYGAGIGLVTGNVQTPTALGGCPEESLDPTTQACKYDLLRNPRMWLGICLGGLFPALLMSYRIRTGILIGILTVAIISWPRDTDVTYFPHTAEGDDRFAFFKKVITFHPIEHVLGAQDWNITNAGSHFALAFFTFLYVDIVDCTATLYSMANYCRPEETGGGVFPRSKVAYCIDAIGISIGSLMGTSPITAFVESGAGIAQGGCTGLTAVTTGLCFLISLFFAPIIASIPPWATGPALILVGCLMCRQVVKVNWNYWGDALPSFVTIAFIPFSYSVAYGLIAGIFVYTAMNLPIWAIMKLTRGRIMAEDYGRKQAWRYGMGWRTWVRNLLRRVLFWRKRDDYNDDSHSGGFSVKDGEGRYSPDRPLQAPSSSGTDSGQSSTGISTVDHEPRAHTSTLTVVHEAQVIRSFK